MIHRGDAKHPQGNKTSAKKAKPRARRKTAPVTVVFEPIAHEAEQQLARLLAQFLFDLTKREKTT